MKKYLFGLLLLANVGYGKMDVAAKYDYTCTKGSKKIVYRIAYRDEDGTPPCRVYQIIDGTRKQIGESMKTSDICEKIIDRILAKVEGQGMICADQKP